MLRLHLTALLLFSSFHPISAQAENLISVSELAARTATDDRPDGGPVTWTDGPGGNVVTSHEPVGFEMGNSYLGFDLRGSQWDYLYAEPDSIVGNLSVSLALQDLSIAKNIGPGREFFSYTLFKNSDREVYDNWFTNIENTGNPQGDFGWDYINGRWYGQFMFDIDQFKPPFISRQSQSAPNNATFVQGDRLAFDVAPNTLTADGNRILTFALRPNTTAQFFTPGQGTTETWGDIRIDFTYDANTHTYIHKWELVDPTDSSLGRQRSNRLTNAGRGPVAEPRANLAGLDLRQAYIPNALLVNADFSDADLKNADLMGAHLEGANLTNAFIQGADLSSTTGLTESQLKSVRSVGFAGLTSVSLRNNSMIGWDFSGTRPELVDFSNADLSNASFTGVRVEGANFERANLTNASYEDATLQQARGQSTTFRNANLSSANLANASFGAGTDLTDAMLEGANIVGARFNGVVGLSEQQLYSTGSYKSGDLRGLIITDQDLSGWDFSNQDLSSERTSRSFSRSNLTGTNFGGANLTSLTFDGDFSGANFTRASGDSISLQVGTDRVVSNLRLDEVKFSRVSIFASGSSALVDSTAQNAEITALQASRTAFTRVSFSGASLPFASFERAQLTDVEFDNADLTDSNFSNAILERVTFDGATLLRVDFTGVNLARMNFGENNLSGAQFEDASLAGANLAGANLTDVLFLGTDLAGANFEDATVGRGTLRNFGGFFDVTSSGFTAEMLYSTRSYKEGRLVGLQLIQNDMDGWNFANQNLESSSFRQSLLRNANFAEANLLRAQFGDADLTNADFRGASLVSANLGSSRLQGASLEDANVVGANFSRTTEAGFSAEMLYSTSSYQSGNLIGVRFDNNDLAGWNLSGIDNYFGSILGANLAGADLSNSRLSSLSSLEQIQQAAKLDGLDLDFNGVYNSFIEVAVVPYLVTSARNFRAIVIRDGVPERVMPRGLRLSEGETLLVRSSDQGRTIVEEQLYIESDAELVFILNTPSAAGFLDASELVGATLDGTLTIDALEFSSSQDVDWSQVLTNDLKIFEWGDTSVDGVFSDIRLGEELSRYLQERLSNSIERASFAESQRFLIDSSRLYSEGVVTIVTIPVPEPSAVALAAVLFLHTAAGLRRRRPDLHRH